MYKTFFDVFPTLKLKDDTRKLLENVEVMKITTNESRDYLHVHLHSKHLIEKKQIYVVETAIKEQLFAKNAVCVQIQECFELSKQYTPENLMREYRDSIFLELKKRSIVEANMFANAKFVFEDENVVRVQFEENIVAEGKADAIVGLLKQVYEVRCNIPVRIQVEFFKTEKSKLEEHKEMRLQQEVHAIMEQNAAKKNTKEEEPAEEKQKKSAQKQENYRAAKKSEDPNLIYGRDFDDEPMELSQVIGEMGEITFRGQVLRLDTREIRNERTFCKVYRR